MSSTKPWIFLPKLAHFQSSDLCVSHQHSSIYTIKKPWSHALNPSLSYSPINNIMWSPVIFLPPKIYSFLTSCASLSYQQHPGTKESHFLLSGLPHSLLTGVPQPSILCGLNQAQRLSLLQTLINPKPQVPAGGIHRLRLRPHNTHLHWQCQHNMYS